MFPFSDVIVLTISLFVLAKSADMVLKNLIKIANSLRWSTFIVSFFILGFATSTPELFVGINAALDNTPQLSLGNVIGASIVLLTLISGLTAFLSGKVVLDSTFARKDLILMNLVIFMPVILLYDLKLSRLDAVIIIITYFVYMIGIYKDRQKLPHPVYPNHKKTSITRHILLFIFGFIGLAIASSFAVDSARDLAEFLNIPILMIGVLIFSIGTNFPELILSITAVKKKQKTIVLGNVLGSTTTNTLVIAIVALIQPFEILDPKVFAVSVIFLALSVFAFSTFTKSKNEISRVEGLFLLSIYSFFVIFEVITKLI
jgi:cation:H+ antiporter